jgi:hypothetical protein
VRPSISSFSAVTAVSLLLIVTAYGIAAVQAGYPVPGEKTELWFANVARLREILYAERTDPSKPTIWIVAGSNALFGTVSNIIAERTGYNVKNYGLHGGLHIDLLFSQIRGKVRKGDIVIAPLEWESRDRPFGNEFDYSNYLHHFSRSVSLSLWTTYKLYTSVPLKHWWNGLVAYINRPKGAQSYWDFFSLVSLREDWELRRRPGKENYTHTALTPAGDFNLPLGVAILDPSKPLPSFIVPPQIKPVGLAQMDRWHVYFESVGARLVVTSPAMIEADNGYIFSRQAWENLEHIRAQMAATSTPLECDPVKSTYSISYRLDTEYHLTKDGARLRSNELADCLLDVIKGKDVRASPIDPDDAIARTRERVSHQKAHSAS